MHVSHSDKSPVSLSSSCFYQVNSLQTRRTGHSNSCFFLGPGLEKMTCDCLTGILILTRLLIWVPGTVELL